MRNTIVAKLALALQLGTALVVAAPSAQADGFSTPAGMRCEDAILVRYHAGPRWADLQTVVGRHLDFMRAQMRVGRLLFGGPFYESGGVEVMRGTDVASVAALVEMDPMVTEHVATYSAERLWLCLPAGARSAR